MGQRQNPRLRGRRNEMNEDKDREVLDHVFHKLMIRDMIFLGIASIAGLSLVALAAWFMGIV
jgi:hypothetical protein